MGNKQHHMECKKCQQSKEQMKGDICLECIIEAQKKALEEQAKITTKKDN